MLDLLQAPAVILGIVEQTLDALEEQEANDG